ncbi:hypothetical protein LSAT2_008339 [Lamellibrachia satsuma]|nr:hypothetical protein LSAT2_008339 [Lamellibrachia satsuma]
MSISCSRDQYRAEYESKLRDELEQIRLRTNTEIDRLKHACHETYERENRSLREARDMALAEKERALATEQDHSTKYEQLMHEYRRLQTNNDCRLGELQSDVKLKSFEQERTSMLYEETVRSLKEAQLNTEKLQKKLEVLTKEYYGLQMSMERQVGELESTLTECTQKLESYERLENELDAVIMQAAEVENEADAERVLFSYGYGANIPTTSKRRLKQSVDLARRVLQLERANTSLRKEVERERAQLKEYSDKLKSSEDLLSQSQQPYHYLVQTIRGKDEQLRREKSCTESLENKLQCLHEEFDGLTRTKNMMAADLERLLGHSEELAHMKDAVRKLGTVPKTNNKRASALQTKALIESMLSKKGSYGQKTVHIQTARDVPTKMMPESGDTAHSMPAPTVFTAPEHADWYKQLKQKHQGRVKNTDLHPREVVVELQKIGDAEVERPVNKMTKDRATGIDEVRVKMRVMAECVLVRWTRRLLNTCTGEGKIPEEWRTGLIVLVWKRKRDVHDLEKYRGITLLRHVLKVLERILDKWIRRIVECEMGEHGFRKGSVGHDHFEMGRCPRGGGMPASITLTQRGDEGEHRRKIQSNVEDAHVAILDETPDVVIHRRPSGLGAVEQRHPHRSIGMTPSQVSAENQEKVWQRMYGHDGKGVPKFNSWINYQDLVHYKD